MTTTRPESYAGLTHDELIARLERAEDVCVLYGWSAATSPNAGDRETACSEAWMRWANWAGDPATSRKANPHMTDEAIHTLAEIRRATRAATLARISSAT